MYPSTLCPEQNYETPEQRLWRAVIARTLQEWMSGPSRHQQAAEAYLFYDKRDFPLVCESAGVNPERLRQRLVQLKSSGAAAPTHSSEAA